MVIWLVGTLTFVLLHMAPGDPVSALANDPRFDPAVQDALRQRDALDQPWPVQYVRYVRGLISLDFGYSFSQRRPVGDVLRDALPHSLLLMGLALFVSIVVGVAVGTWQASHVDSRADHLLGAVTGGLAAVPEVWLATVLLALFAVEWPLFPLTGRCDPLSCGTGSFWSQLADVLHHVALPALTLSLLFTATFARVQRTALRPVLTDTVVRTAIAKGVAPQRVLLHHGLRRALRPTLTDIGLSLPALIGGGVLVERIFGWPGLGSALVEGIAMRDYPLVTAGAMTGGTLVVVGGLLAELVNARLDPRLRSGTH